MNRREFVQSGIAAGVVAALNGLSMALTVLLVPRLIWVFMFSMRRWQTKSASSAKRPGCRRM